jgi:protein SCO1/2
MHPRNLFIIAVSFAVGAIIALTIFYGGQPGLRTAEGKIAVGGPFSLTTTEGKRVTEKDFLGKYMLIAFGYTYCPDICPSELQEIANALDDIGVKADNIVPVFISVDPERDTPEQLKQFTENFSPRIVGLVGTPDEIKAVLKVYRAYAKKERSSSPGVYAITHSAYIYIIDPKGEYVDRFDYPVTSDKIAAKLRKIVPDNLPNQAASNPAEGGVKQ